jgi:hypothetical protein
MQRERVGKEISLLKKITKAKEEEGEVLRITDSRMLWHLLNTSPWILS